MTIWLVDLESVETRYTCQWKKGLPEAIVAYGKSLGKIGWINWESNTSQPPFQFDFYVNVIEGQTASQEATPGAFLNFAGTNIYKSQQAEKMAQAFRDGRVMNGDKILVTDAWNPAIIQFKYMAELLDIDVEIHAIWHAGSYDPQDFLGRKITDKRWTNRFEQSLFHAIDYNYFATNFHIDLFKNNVFGDVTTHLSDIEIEKKFVRSGQPHGALVNELVKFAELEKTDTILFPHRVAPEKQPGIFRDMATLRSEYQFIVCQDQKLTKEEYHIQLGQSKVVFSANLQETLGISAMEAILVGSIPLLPDRLSYSEMYDDFFLYPSELTATHESYMRNKDILLGILDEKMQAFQDSTALRVKMQKQKEVLLRDYLSADAMISRLFQ